MIRFLILIYYITDYSIRADLCSQVLSLDCDSQYVPTRDESVCATDGITYKTCCHFAQAKCKDEQIAIQNVGSCFNGTLSTNSTETPSCVTFDTTTIKTTTDVDPMEDLFCMGVAAGSVKCTEELDPFCGTDSKFYKNNCYFQSARCINRDLLKQPIDMCKGTN